MAAETLNKRSSVECWMATPDHTIEREAAWPTDDIRAWFSQKTETEINVYWTQRLPEKVITNVITYADVTKSIKQERILSRMKSAQQQQTIGITGIAAASDCTVQEDPVAVA